VAAGTASAVAAGAADATSVVATPSPPPTASPGADSDGVGSGVGPLLSADAGCAKRAGGSPKSRFGALTRTWIPICDARASSEDAIRHGLTVGSKTAPSLQSENAFDSKGKMPAPANDASGPRGADSVGAMAEERVPALPSDGRCSRAASPIRVRYRE